MPNVFLSALAIGSLMIAPVYAGQKSKASAAPHGSPHTTTSPKATGPKTTASPKTTTATGPKTTTTTTSTHGNPQKTTATTTTKAHGNPHAATSGGNTTTATTGTSATTGTGTTAGTGTGTTTTTPLNPIAQKLQGKPLGARIEKMLPSTMTLNTASAGFRNQGQFIAAVHVSQNLGIPFADLRATMLGLPLPSRTPTPGTPATIGTAATGTTTASPLSLGQAIQKLRPSANSTTEAARAQTQATADLSTSSTTTATTTTKKKGR